MNQSINQSIKTTSHPADFECSKDYSSSGYLEYHNYNGYSVRFVSEGQHEEDIEKI